MDGKAQVARGVVLWGRAGFVARGAVYLIIGALAALAALGQAGGQTTDNRGALMALLDQPLGTALLWAVGAGLAGYAVWRVVDAVLDVEGRGAEPTKLAVRAAHLVGGLAHGALAVFAVRLALGDGGAGGGGDGMARATGEAFQFPGGRWLVLLAGAITVVVGGVHLVRGARGFYERRLERKPGKWLCRAGRFGHATRGLVIAMIGGFLVVAAVRFASGEARGVEGALDALRAQPFGRWLLLAAGLGLAAFGVWSLVEARLRYMPAPPARASAQEALASRRW